MKLLCDNLMYNYMFSKDIFLLSSLSPTRLWGHANFYLLSIRKYLCLFSTIIHRRNRLNTREIPIPMASDATKIFVHNMPTIKGIIITAPIALVLGNRIGNPPTISANPTSGISQKISIMAPKSFCISVGIC